MYKFDTKGLGIKGFSFDGIHSDDMNVVLENYSISTPEKRKITETVPFMNGTYDFSTALTGEITYNDREIKITIGFLAKNKNELEMQYSKVAEWLIDRPRCKLIFDRILDYYFTGEVVSSTTMNKVLEYGKMEITFTCDPFRYSRVYVGEIEWDTFNFEEDYLETCVFDINGETKCVIHNPGRSVRPVIVSTAQMTMIYDSVKYSLVKGDNNLYGFYLKSGQNEIVFKGKGTILIRFRKEVL